MDKLPEGLVLEILSRLDDSSDVARCRLAWKTFNTVSPHLRSINLQWSLQRYIKSRSRVSNSSTSSQLTTPLKTIFLNLISNSRVVESIRISADIIPVGRGVSFTYLNDSGDDLYLTDGDFVKEWLPRVSGALKSLSISDFWIQSCRCRSNALSLISAYCHNLVELEVKGACFPPDNLNLMPMLTSLTLKSTRFEDRDLSQLNRCFPNLQVLNLIGVSTLNRPSIHLLNLKTCHLTLTIESTSVSLITPNLISLRLECEWPSSLYLEAPMLSHFHLALEHVGAFRSKNFENLKTLWLESFNIRSILAKFQVRDTVENLTLEARDSASRWMVTKSRFSLRQLLYVFPSLTYLCFNSSVWSEFEACYDPSGLVACDGRKGLKMFRGYLLTIDPSWTFDSVASVLEQCVNLVDVWFLIHRDVAADISELFITGCMLSWTKVKWRWGIWEEGIEDKWMTDEQVDSIYEETKKLAIFEEEL